MEIAQRDDVDKLERKLKILMFAGSTRKESFNKRLIQATSKYVDRVKFTIIDLVDYPLPIYDAEFEEKHGQPESAKRLHKLISEHESMIIASPEYNGLPSPLLINVIDWISRVSTKVYAGKTAAIVSASPGAYGGRRNLNHLRTLLENLEVLVIAEQVSIGNAGEAFDYQGTIVDKKQNENIAFLVEKLIQVTIPKAVALEPGYAQKIS